MLLLLARSRAVIETWRVDKLTVINKLKINVLMLLLSSTDGPLLRYMHVFRIMQNVQVKFVGLSGIFYVPLSGGFMPCRHLRLSKGENIGLQSYIV